MRSIHITTPALLLATLTSAQFDAQLEPLDQNLERRGEWGDQWPALMHHNRPGWSVPSQYWPCIDDEGHGESSRTSAGHGPTSTSSSPWWEPTSETKSDQWTKSSEEASTTSSSKGHKPTSAPPPKPIDKYRGVNLGGWLVLEEWITPSLFRKASSGVIDEYTFSSHQSKSTAKRLLTEHWDTWITEDDFAQIAAAGLNSVRVPIGSWAFALFEDEPYTQGQVAYLDKAIEWGRKYGIRVMIDLHGAPGSQNGFDNSGRAGDMRWPDSKAQIDHTVKVIAQIADKYTQEEYKGVVTDIFLLNEPAGFKGDHLTEALRGYQEAAYAAIRNRPNDNNVGIILHDAFLTPQYWKNYMATPSYTNLMMDTHYYHAFDETIKALDAQGQIQRVCSKSGLFADSAHPVITAEWSLGIGAPNLNTPDYDDFLRRFWDVQTQTFEKYGAGWTFWCWKTETSPEWSYKDSMAKGWIPRDAAEHKYGLSDLCW